RPVLGAPLRRCRPGRHRFRYDALHGSSRVLRPDLHHGERPNRGPRYAHGAQGPIRNRLRRRAVRSISARQAMRRKADASRGAFFGFVRKEFRHILRDRRTLVVLFGMPVLMMGLFGYAIRNELENVRIGVAGATGDEVARRIIQRMDASSLFEVVEEVTGSDGIEDGFRHGRFNAAVIFEPGFAGALQRPGPAHVQVITDASNPNPASTVQAYVEAVLRGSGMEPALFQMRYNPELKSAYLFVPGVMAVILMLVSALMTSITIT